MKYQKLHRWKYRLAKKEIFETGWELEVGCSTDYIRIERDGRLTIEPGYCWDGPSGPTIDRRTNMRGSLAHDALYQLMRMGLLSTEYRIGADMYLAQCWREDGMWPWVAHLEVALVSLFGGNSAEPRPNSEPTILEAP